MTNLENTEQEKDLSEPPNCNGFGRIRHFRRETSDNWPSNPLPMDPACRALHIPSAPMIRAQAYQSASCNWRCWYCFVPFDLLAANPKYSKWLDVGTLVDLYMEEPERPRVIDLTGGQPDLVPEWVPWMMAELRQRGLEKEVYLWSDDNLSTDYFWKFLSDADIELVASYQNYGRVCCFKGFDPESFEFNTLADARLFSRQFELMKRFIDLGIDLYAYVTLTTPSVGDMRDKIGRFVDRLQSVDESLPLRTVPLEIQLFTPVRSRMDPAKHEALKNQVLAVEMWTQELEARFSNTARTANIASISFRRDASV